MSKKNAIEKFQAFLKRLESEERRDLYRVMSALRGPDIDNGVIEQWDLVAGKGQYLKDSTTARIRALLWGDYIDSGLCDIRRHPLTKSEQKALSDWVDIHRFDEGLKHFIDHYETAIRGIRHLAGYDLLTETQVEEKNDG